MFDRSILRQTCWLLALALLAAALGAPTAVAALSIVRVSAVSPASGSLAGGTTVTITGSNFTAPARVTFGGTAATAVVVVSGTQIVCRTLPHAAGVVTVTVTVTNPFPTSGSLVNGFAYASGVTTPTKPVRIAQEFSAGISANSNLQGIAAGPDGNLWFTESDGNRIGRITPAGIVTEFSIPTAISYPRGIAAGPDGNLWFTEDSGNKIGRITISGVVTESAIPTGGSSLHGIVAGSDGNLWFVESSPNKIGRITPAGVVTEFPVSTASASYPYEIAAGPDGNLWFTELNASNIGRITTNGSVTEFSVGRGQKAIAAGPDDNLWFTEFTGRIGVLFLAPPTITRLSPFSGPANATTSITITGTGFAPGTTVSFGDTPAAVLVNNPTSITAIAPGHAPGTVDVSVTSGGSTATVRGFTYGTPDPLPPPRPPGSSGRMPDPLPPSRGGSTVSGTPDALPPSRPLFP